MDPIHVAKNNANSDLARLGRELRMIGDCNRALVRAQSEDDLLNEICRLIVEQGGYLCAWVAYAEHDEAKSIRVVAQLGIEADFVKLLSWGDGPHNCTPAPRAIRERTTQISHEIQNDPVLAPWHAEAARRGHASLIALP